MNDVGHSEAVLRFFGDDLLPEAVSALLGAEPTSCVRKGEEIVGRSTGNIRIAPTGRWSLMAARREPEGLDAQVFEILNRLTSDLDVWQSLVRYEPDLFCGIFMESTNDMLLLSAPAMFGGRDWQTYYGAPTTCCCSRHPRCVRLGSAASR